jgi:hypothetical protein
MDDLKFRVLTQSLIAVFFTIPDLKSTSVDNKAITQYANIAFKPYEASNKGVT